VSESNSNNNTATTNTVSTASIAREVMHGMGLATTDEMSDIAAENARAAAKSEKMSQEVDDVLDGYNPRTNGHTSDSATVAIAESEFQKAANIQARRMATDALPAHLRSQAREFLEHLTEADIKEVFADYARRTDTSWQERRKEALKWATTKR
jgi:hypothetical protein